jgi:hypothetical protein
MIEQEEVLLPEEVEGGEQTEQVEVTPNDTEDRARMMGWVPKEEFRGDESRWSDAETFVKRGEERLPVMKENLHRLEAKYKALEEKLQLSQEYQKTMGERQYQRALKELTEKQERAVEDSDLDAYKAIEKEKKELNEVYSPKQPTASQEDPVVTQWKAKNTWYTQNQQMAQVAYSVEQAILAEESLTAMDDPFYQPMTLGERLEEVSKRVREKVSSRQAVRRLPAVEGTRQQATKKAAKTWNDIPSADRDSAEKWVKSGVISREEYLKDYFGE